MLLSGGKNITMQITANKSHKNKLLVVENVSKSYGENLIIENLNFSINSGEIVSIMGPSGVGKTSLINILLGLDNKYSGRISAFSDKVSVSFQEDRLLPWLNLYQNISVVSKNGDSSKIRHVLDVMKLGEFTNYMTSKLSGGMRERAAIARALYFDFDLLILDEPLKSTDKRLGREILDYIKSQIKASGKALLMISHEPEYAIRISDKIYILEGRPANIKRQIDVKSSDADTLKGELEVYYMDKKVERIPGHVLLASLGKKRLRPGGVEATNWLIENAHIDSNSKILEVACNMGTTLIDIVKKYNCRAIGVDKDAEALEQAKINIKNAGLEHKIELINGDALNLPFEDESFDIVINEAMLTMLNNENKKKAISEYFRVLKNGGTLLNHDIKVDEENSDIVKELRQVINVSAVPLQEEHWTKLLKDSGFAGIKVKTGYMSLMSEDGMKKDEGEAGMLQILEKAKSHPNFEQFVEMKDFFARNYEYLNYIAICSQK